MNDLISSASVKAAPQTQQAAENNSAEETKQSTNKNIKHDEHKLKNWKSVHGVAVCLLSSMSILSGLFVCVCWFLFLFLFFQSNYSLDTGVNTSPAVESSWHLSIMYFWAEINRSGNSNYTAAQPLTGSEFGSHVGCQDLVRPGGFTFYHSRYIKQNPRWQQ